MPQINPGLPVVGQPDSTEEPKVVTALSQLISAVNTVDSAQIADGTIAAADLVTALAQALVPAGTILATAGSTADAGYLMCDGSAQSRSTFSALFAKIGTTYGTGDGTTTFNLPDSKGRSLLGAGTGSGLSARTLGAKLGSEPSNHPAHTHDAPGTGFVTNPGASNAVNGSSLIVGGTTSTVTAGVTSSTGVGADNMQPNLVVNYQIKT